jgi:hypothetical protein
MVPAPDMDPIVGLGHEVFLDVINDNGFGKIATQLREVLHVNAIPEFSVVPVQSMGDVALPVEVIEDPIRIVL